MRIASLPTIITHLRQQHYGILPCPRPAYRADSAVGRKAELLDRRDILVAVLEGEIEGDADEAFHELTAINNELFDLGYRAG